MRRMDRGINIKVHPSLYDRIERERKKFMEKQGLTKLSTVAFTGILSKNLIGNKSKWKKYRTRKAM